MWKLLAVLFLVDEADNTVYRKVGDSVVLTPVNLGVPISFITWKHGPNIAVEWQPGKLDAYRDFIGCSEVNNQTGALTITRLNENHSGLYEVEINQKQLTDSTLLRIIAPVSKPTVSSWCDLEMTYCLFTCNTTGAEPITYRWLSGGDVLKSIKVLNITKEDRELSFSCQVENLVSLQSSDMPNPFTRRNRMFTLTCLIPLAVGGIVLLYFLIAKKGTKPCRRKSRSPPRPGSAVDGDASDSEVQPST